MTQLQANANCELVPIGNGAVAEELAVDAAVVQAAVMAETATHAHISIKTANVLVTFDGVAPVAGGNGALYQVGEKEVWQKARLEAAKFIEAVGAADGVVHIEPMAFAPV